MRSCLGQYEFVASQICKTKPGVTSQTTETSARTVTTSGALQLQGRRDQKTTTVGEFETKEFLKHWIL